jgi:hypothetical protein
VSALPAASPDGDLVKVDRQNGLVTASVVAVTAGEHLNGPTVPARELRKSASDWDVSVTLGHPEVNDEFVPLSEVDASEWVVGRLTNPEYLGDVKGIRADAVLDAEALADHGDAGERVVETLVRDVVGEEVPEDDQIHVSVGYRHGTQSSPRYGKVATDLDPDHLALLPGSLAPGACDPVDGGCGLPRLNHALRRAQRRGP